MRHTSVLIAATAGTYYSVLMTADDIYTVAGNGTCCFSGDGGPATAASIAYPMAIVPDGSGNLILSDSLGNRVRVVAGATASRYGLNMTSGDIYSLTGDGMCGYSGDGGPATSAEVCGPAELAVDRKHRVLIADMYSHRVRRVTA